MNPQTGAIAHFEKVNDAIMAGFTESLDEKEAEMLSHMNRHDRRKWLAQNRKQNSNKN